MLNSIPVWGGGEKWVVSAGGSLQARGHRVWVAAARGSLLAERATSEGLPLWEAPVGRLGFRWGTRARFQHLLEQEGIEAVIGNVGRDLRMAAPPCLRTDTALLQRRGLLRPIKPTRSNRRLYRHVARIIVNAAAIRDRMLEEVDFVGPDRFDILPNGVALPELDPGVGAAMRTELQLAPERPVAAVVGRLSAMKGHRTLFAAWPAVVEQLPGAVLLVIGQGELERALRHDIAERGLQDTVRFLGFRSDVSRLLQAIDLVVIPSERDEGFSNAVLEAMAHGVPAVVTRCGGLPEVVADGQTGRVVPIGASPALAAAVTELLADPERRQQLGEQARGRVEEQYTQEAVTRSLEEILRKLRR